MIISLNEAESLASRAALGVGAAYGAADDAAAAVRWLLARGLPWLPPLVAALDKVASGVSHWGRLEERPAFGDEASSPLGSGGCRCSGLWSADEGRESSTVLIGGAASDWFSAFAAEGRAELCLEPVDVPLLLLPSLLTAAAWHGFDAHVCRPGFAASGHGAVVAFQGCGGTEVAACRSTALRVATTAPRRGEKLAAGRRVLKERLRSVCQCQEGFEVADDLGLRLERHAQGMLVSESRASRAGGAGPAGSDND